jgi:hypothetical protein
MQMELENRGTSVGSNGWHVNADGVAHAPPWDEARVADEKRAGQIRHDCVDY